MIGGIAVSEEFLSQVVTYVYKTKLYIKFILDITARESHLVQIISVQVNNFQDD